MQIRKRAARLRDWMHRYRWMIAGAGVFLLLAAAFSVYLLIGQLEERFHAVHDSVPTRIYSSAYIFRPGAGASPEELRFRLRERDYRETRPGEERSPGSFSLQLDEQRGLRELVLNTNEFPYPDFVRALFFGPEQKPASGRHTVSWEGGKVKSVRREDGTESPQPLALEPTLIARLNEGNRQARKTVPIAQIPHTLLEAVVLTEDQRFLGHIGFDPRGIARSVWVNLRSGGRAVQGASTITQQLARNMFLNNKRTLSRKLKELIFSIALEIYFTKDEILEKYLNEVYLGQSGNIAIHGVAEAAKFYFNKPLEELSIAEQALMTGIIKGPPYYSPFRHLDRARGRQEIVLGKMRDAGVITEAQHKAALAEPVRLARASTIQNRAPYFTEMVQAQLLRDLPDQEPLGSGYTIYSTLDTYLQEQAELAVEAGVARIEANLKRFREIEASRRQKRKAPPAPGAEAVAAPSADEAVRLVQGLFLGVDPANGHILSLVGGRSFEESNFNRVLLMRRHVGSLMKPFVYLSALLNGRNPDGTPMNSVTKFEDKPVSFEFDRKQWSPRNYDDGFEGTVTMRHALAHSINTVAAQVAVETGLDRLVETARSAGFEAELKPLPSLSLGAVEATPLDVARAYVTLAGFGVRKELTATLAIVADDGRPVAQFQPNESQALPPEETANLVQMMSSVFDTGTARPSRDAGFVWPAAGKTGTTNEFRDAWFAGFSRKTLGISWVGFDRDDEIVRKHRKALKLTGAVAALPVWTQYMLAAHRQQDPEELAYPDGALRRVEVDLISGGRANLRCMGESVVEEFFTTRNVPSHECN